MSLKIAFFPHNQPHTKFFSYVADLLKKEDDIDSLFVKEVGRIEGQEVFQFEVELEKIWGDIDISSKALGVLQRKYPDFDFMRALYSEREFNYYPYFFGSKAVSSNHQLKYLVGCFEVFNTWLDIVSIDFIVSELIIGMADGVLKEVSERRAVPYYSFRQSKMIPGVVVCNSYYDEPLDMADLYQEYVDNGIPQEIKRRAEEHINSLKYRIEHPSYMELTKKPLKITPFKIVRSIFRGLMELNKVKDVTSLTIRKKPRVEAYKMILQRVINIYRMRKNHKKWFTKEITKNDKYIIYPLHYEPEASTLVRAFRFSDQLALIKQITKALPLDVMLVVKEHGGNRGYRKTEFYRELSYMPNVVLRPPEYSVTDLISNCLCVITLTGRMGWEAIVNDKPVITLGRSYWSSFDMVYNVQSPKGISDAIAECHHSSGNSDVDMNKLLPFTSAYINCVHKANFVINGESFMTENNINAFRHILLGLILSRYQA
jgi:hypothetical protein